jgi:Arc/MetJ-type ribon-helix-helix transcriptional regulator
MKISVSVDARLLAAVDAFVAEHPGTGRSTVIDEALRLWYAREQERAMEIQFAAPESPAEHGERAAWRRTRRAADGRRFSPRG